ncbi:hypothetical protein RND71_004282 [Anisodus tanguticus]|uniref:AAA+ ATPase At3g28540-like C-terminal domain-containing protein n=1 Tax=Anisodus tanguticus TaxID=243964 RepID=A0AAE1SYC4_9SOLA|nr:hypothetical protein RND71_004282 [Anisodus tanguticus]
MEKRVSVVCPPGTGKSSLIAPMANYLNFDIYDLELTEVKKNTDLRQLLVATTNKSILVVEDIDATIDLQEKLSSRVAAASDDTREEESKVTLSGLLNFIDGLWSSCGDERIIIFTTNHVEKLDPALLLASNYLGITEHQLFEEIENLIQITAVTPAEVAEQLMKEDEIDIALEGLIYFLHMKKKEHKVSKIEEEENE